MDFSAFQAWLHVALVHVPVVLSPLAIFLLVRSWRDQHTQDLRLSHGLILLCAITATVAYFTGPTTMEWWQGKIDLNQEAIEDHGLWGRISFTIMALAGAGSLIALLSDLQDEPVHPAVEKVVLVLLATGCACMIWTAHLGGLLRRPELAF